MARNLKLDQLTFLRFIAAILVVIYHYGKNIYPFNLGFIHGLVDRGAVYVSFFFVLSGFVLHLTYANKMPTLRVFYLKRVARIVPIYFASIILTFVAFSLSGRPFPPLDPLIQLTMINAWIPKYALVFNYVGWSISVEIFFYLIFPVWVVFFRRTNSAILYIATLGLLILTQLTSMYFSEHTLAVSFHPLFHLNSFLIGMLAGRVYLNSKQSNLPNIYSILSILLFGLLIQYPLDWLNYRNGSYAILFALIIFIVSKSNWFKEGKFANILITLGNSSYSIYILQVPIFYLFSYYLKEYSIDQPTTFFYLYLCSLVILSVITFRWIEMPAKERIISRFN